MNAPIHSRLLLTDVTGAATVETAGPSPVLSAGEALAAAYADWHNFSCPYAWARAHPIISQQQPPARYRDGEEDVEGEYR